MKEIYTIIFSIFIATEVYGTQPNHRMLTRSTSVIYNEAIIPSPSTFTSNQLSSGNLRVFVEACFIDDLNNQNFYYFNNSIRVLMGNLYQSRKPDWMQLVLNATGLYYQNLVNNEVPNYYEKSLQGIRELAY